MIRHAWVWFERSDGTIEQHVGPFEALVKVDVKRPNGGFFKENVLDEKLAEAIMKVLSPFNGAKVYDVMLELSKPKVIERDKTGCLRKVAEAIEEVGLRVIERQKRGERGKLRAEFLADFELANMTFRYRAE